MTKWITSDVWEMYWGPDTDFDQAENVTRHVQHSSAIVMSNVQTARGRGDERDEIDRLEVISPVSLSGSCCAG